MNKYVLTLMENVHGHERRIEVEAETAQDACFITEFDLDNCLPLGKDCNCHPLERIIKIEAINK
jgi:hypothetical protein